MKEAPQTLSGKYIGTDTHRAFPILGLHGHEEAAYIFIEARMCFALANEAVPVAVPLTIFQHQYAPPRSGDRI